MSDASQSLASYWNPAGISSLYTIAHYLGQEEGAVAVIHKCNLCGAEYNNSAEYKAHLKTHFDHRCPYCDYVSKTEGRLKRHVKDLHNPPGAAADSTIAEPNSESDDSSRQQDTNRGKNRRDKPRVCKCKHCGFTTRTREEFWEHAKKHIREGKGLECPRCPFVTEYKHHLEYHLRNHFGSKPFKCHKCNYSCVNKSMLNSHLKSHSNVYQYRCENCNYATKYCHSLKLHLRKYNHQPATVLNPDGTPNPYPIIDVYGTRRGPRPKKTSSQPQPQQISPVQPSTVLPPNVDSGSPEVDLSRVDWLSALTMAGVPVFHWPIPVEVRQALMEQAEKGREQQIQTETAEKERSIIDKVELLAIKEEADDWSEDAPLDLSRSSPDSRTSPYGAPATPPSAPSPSVVGRRLTVSPGTYSCRYCELDFGDCSMHKIHMEYHGTDNPFKCKVCGKQTADRLDFYVHLTRNPH